MVHLPFIFVKQGEYYFPDYSEDIHTRDIAKSKIL